MFCFFRKKTISAFLDDELAEKDRRKISEHLRNCKKCQSFLEELRGNNLRIEKYLTIRKKMVPDLPASGPVTVNYRPEEDAEGINTEDGLSGGIRQLIISFKRITDSILFETEDLNGSELATNGVVTLTLAARLIPAILAALAVILLYAPSLIAYI